MKDIINEIKYNRLYYKHITIFKSIVVEIDGDDICYMLHTARQFDDWYEPLLETTGDVIMYIETHVLEELFDIDDINIITDIIIRNLNKYERIDK